MHENREETEIEKETLMGYAPFKDLSLNQHWEMWYRGINPSKTGPVSDFMTLQASNAKNPLYLPTSYSV